MLLTRELTKVFRAFFYVNLKDGVFNVKESYKIRFRPLLSKHCLCGVECQFETVVIMLLSTSPNLRKVNHRKQGKTATDLSQFYPVGTETLMDNNGSKYAHFHTFCGFLKLKVLNLYCNFPSQNPDLHFSTV